MLEIEGLEAQYGGKRALGPLSISAHKGSCVGLVGRNGSGKTTFLHALCGIGSSTGRRTLNGKALLRGVSHDVSLVESDPVLVDSMTVEEAVRFDAAMRGMRLSREELDRALSLFDCTPFSDVRVRSCSLGMRKRAALSAAWTGSPKLVILDEPTNGLDTESIFRLVENIEVTRCNGGIVFMSSHDLAFAQRRCDRVLMLDQGAVVADLDTDTDDVEREFYQRFIAQRKGQR